MCTVSVIPFGHRGLRLVTNRDESGQRPPALPPRWHALPSGHHAIWPTDPSGGGTWVAASQRSLVLCALNLNLEPPPPLPGGLTSRGLIIPALIDAPGLDAFLDAMARFNPTPFAPFRLLAVEPGDAGPRAAVARWDRQRLTIDRPPPGPFCLVSSGLGDSKAAPRLALFDRLVAGDPTPARQDALHRHAWPTRRDISVMMHREGARTVSITSVLAGPRVDMEYQAVDSLRAAAVLEPASGL